MKMMHPRSKQVIETDPTRVRLYVSQGWKAISADPAEAAALPPCPKCGATKGPCVTPSGATTAKPHAARLEATQA